MRSKSWLVIIVAGVLVVGALALGFWMAMQKGMYSVGDARALVAAETTPPKLHDTGEIEVAPGIRLHHMAVGSGPDLLTIHGGPCYAPEQPWAAAEPLGKSYRLHFYDQRGCGRSTRPIDKLASKSTWEAMKEIEGQLGLAIQISDIDRIRRAVGQDRVVLVAPANLVVMPKAGPDLFELIARRLPADRAAAYAEYRKQYFDFPALARQDERSLSRFYAAFGAFYSQATGSTASVTEGQAGGFMPMAVFLGLGRKADFRAALSKVTAPVLVVHGAADMIPVEDSKQFASYLQNARLEVIPSAGHFVFNDAPVPAADAIARFLSTAAAN